MLVARWLEREAEAGRSKLLVPELLALEEALRRRCGAASAAMPGEEWRGALHDLVHVLRWGVGEFWAPHYDHGAGGTKARALLGANVPVTSALSRSAALECLSPSRPLLCMPLHVGPELADPTIRQLTGLHCGDVHSVCFNASGQRLASGGADGTVCLWETATGKCTQRIEAHTDCVRALSTAANDLHIVSGGDDRAVRVFETASGSCTQTFMHNDLVRSVEFCADNRRVVSGSFDNTVCLWDIATGERTQRLRGHTDCVRAVSMSACCQRIVSGSQDSTVRVWDVATGACTVLRSAGKCGTVQSVGFSAEGLVVSGSFNGTVHVWDPATSECTQTLRGHQDSVCQVQFSAWDTRVLSSSLDAVRTWQVASGKCTHVIAVDSAMSSVTSMSISADGRRVVTGGANGTVCVWDAAGKAALATQASPRHNGRPS